MKAAAIGTIMPWTGDLTLIPKGWVLCSGQTVLAREYPLLAQTIGTTYGGSGFGGTFPNYTGSFNLPALNDSHLADIDSAYFAAGQTVDNTTIDNAEALSVVSTYIGANASSNNLPTQIADAYTDIVFNYTPENDFTGRITGATVNRGESNRTLYTSPRKLGRRHIAGHSHGGIIENISGNNNTTPGLGVIPYANIKWTVQNFYQGFGTLPATPSWELYIGVPGPGGVSQGSNTGGPDGFGNGNAGKILANVVGEAPWVNMTPNQVGSANSHPISNWFGNASGKSGVSFSLTGKFDKGGSVPYGPGGNNLSAPNRNYDPGDANSGVGDANSFGNKVLYNKSAVSFNFNSISSVGGPDQYIRPHSHDVIDVQFDTGNLRLPNSVTSNTVTSNVTPDNTQGVSALNVTANVSQPNMICIYLIRAY